MRRTGSHPGTAGRPAWLVTSRCRSAACRSSFRLQALRCWPCWSAFLYTAPGERQRDRPANNEPGRRPLAAMRRFLSQVGAKFTAALDPDGKIADAYGVTFGLPTSVFVDRTGTVRVIHLGQMAPDFIDQQALALL